MKTLKLVLFVVFAIVLTVSIGMAASNTFTAKMTGKDVVPAVATKAHGKAQFKLSKDGKELAYTLEVTNLENASAAHIHTGTKSESGAPVAGLFAGPKKEGKFSGELAKGTIMDKDLVGPLAGKTLGDLVKMIKDKQAYVHVHTDKYPDGEIRGQIK